MMLSANISGGHFHPRAHINWENPQHWSVAVSRTGAACPKYRSAAGELGRWNERGCGGSAQHLTETDTRRKEDREELEKFPKVV